jgi:hypothetical protein
VVHETLTHDPIFFGHAEFCERTTHQLSSI